MKPVSLIISLCGLIVFFFFISACKTPPVPPEVERAREQENELWRAGALVYVPQEYANHLLFLRLTKEKFIKEKAKFSWFRDYETIQADFRELLVQGEALLEKVQQEKVQESRGLSQRLSLLNERIRRLKILSLTMNENERVRKNLTRAEIAAKEADLLLQNEKYRILPDKLALIDSHIGQAVDALFSVLARYADGTQVETWRIWAEETIAESRKKGATAIIVNKLERTLTLYKKGGAVAVHKIGLGKYGLSDKLYAGDEATPEGKYRVVKKNPKSRFHRALLINYPNEEDKKHFLQAKKKGLIPPGAGIGGLIEIHGGGIDSLTNGCIGVEDDVIEKLFPEVSVGTPVTIIGSLESAAELLASLRKS